MDNSYKVLVHLDDQDLSFLPSNAEISVSATIFPPTESIQFHQGYAYKIAEEDVLIELDGVRYMGHSFDPTATQEDEILSYLYDNWESLDR